ncbi:hypothetical protein MAR_031573 [Mya arenaria]|uniref:Laminin EGF-like domain-containing protein n=1 Tax=Mya arenaria TaxID=6604 RepID=A0ABY7F6I0_MYAAR|nr:hypothetical protein MAR_031573 [Mya arenaria]
MNEEWFRGDKCGVCVDGRYGEKCSKICGPGCLENNCSLTDGKCVCKDFYKGDKCDVCEDVRYGDAKQNHPDETDNFQTGALTWGVIGAVVVLLTAVAITVLIKRRLSQKEAQNYENKRETTNSGGNATKPGPYETLNTSRIEKNDRRDTYSRLFTTGQAGMTSASPNRSTVDLLNAVGDGNRDP